MSLVSERESYLKSLQYAGATQLPEGIDKDKIWVWAIASVLKITGRKEYVIIQHEILASDTVSNRYKVIKDMGNSSKIARIIDIFPFEYVSYIPDVKGKAAISKWLEQATDSISGYYDNFSKLEIANEFKRVLILKHVAHKKRTSYA